MGRKRTTFLGSFDKPAVSVQHHTDVSKTQSTSSMSKDIRHDADNNRFVGVTDNGDEYYVEYNLLEQNVLNCVHTFVPPSGRGKGLAGKLVVFAFEHCIKNNCKIKPSCTYISDTFLKKEKTRGI